MSAPLNLCFGAWLCRTYIDEGRAALVKYFNAFRAMEEVLQSVCIHLGHRGLTDPLLCAWQGFVMVRIMMTTRATSWSDEVASQYVPSHENQGYKPIFAITTIPHKERVHEQLKHFKSLLLLAVDRFDDLTPDFALYITTCLDSVEDILSVLEHRS